MSVFAGNRESTLTLSAGAGNLNFATGHYAKNTSLGFIGAGYNFSYHWGLDSILGFFTTKSRLSVDNGRQINGTIFALDALYRFNPYRQFEAYVLAGPGVMGLNPNGNNPNNEGNVNAGLGVQYFFSESLALRAEARDFYTITSSLNDIMLDGGITYLINL